MEYIGPIILIAFVIIKILSVINSYFREKTYKKDFEEQVGSKQKAEELISNEAPKAFLGLTYAVLIISLPLLVIIVSIFIFN